MFNFLYNQKIVYLLFLKICDSNLWYQLEILVSVFLKKMTVCFIADFNFCWYKINIMQNKYAIPDFIPKKNNVYRYALLEQIKMNANSSHVRTMALAWTHLDLTCAIAQMVGKIKTATQVKFEWKC